MILLLAKKKCQHADLIEKSLRKYKATFFRLNTDLIQVSVFLEYKMTKNGYSGSIKTSTKNIEFGSIKAIWWFEIDITFDEKKSIESEYVNFAQQETYSLSKTIFASLNTYHINHPDNIVLASNKLKQLQLAKNIGFYIPNTLISSEQSTIKDFLKKNKKIIYKTLSHPTLINEGKELVIYTNEVSVDDLTDKDALKVSLNLFQSNIDKKVEIRATVIGDKVFACEIQSQKSDLTMTDWRVYDLSNVPHYAVNLPSDINEKCLKMTKELDLEYSTIDLILDNQNRYWFLEVNPNGLWAWVELLTDLKISDEFAKTLIKKGYNKKYSAFGK